MKKFTIYQTIDHQYVIEQSDNTGSLTTTQTFPTESELLSFFEPFRDLNGNDLKLEDRFEVSDDGLKAKIESQLSKGFVKFKQS